MAAFGREADTNRQPGSAYMASPNGQNRPFAQAFNSKPLSRSCTRCYKFLELLVHRQSPPNPRHAGDDRTQIRSDKWE